MALNLQHTLTYSFTIPAPNHRNLTLNQIETSSNLITSYHKGKVKALLHYAMFHWRFLFFLALFYFSLRFVIPTCWYHKCAENMRKREKIAKREKNSEKMFLYLHSYWVKTSASCVYHSFFSHLSHVFAHKPYQNANPGHSVIWA